MNGQRIGAIIFRHALIYWRNVSRLFDIVFWPVLEIVLWGFIASYLASGGKIPSVIALFLGALMLWEIMYRSNLGVTVSFLEDIWTRNQLNLFASPLTPIEYIVGTITSSFIRVLLTSVILVVFAAIAYGFNILHFGLPLLGFYINLVLFGWSIGIFTIAVITRFGQSAEIFGWAVAFMIQPFAAVWYPVAILPHAFQAIANAMPAAHVFEGMRKVIATGSFDHQQFWIAVVLNALYLVITIWFYLNIFAEAKRSGRLVRAWQ